VQEHHLKDMKTKGELANIKITTRCKAYSYVPGRRNTEPNVCKAEKFGVM
jgi:hypothetical protein